MALDLTETRVVDNAQFSEMLNDLQANILKHHGREIAFHLFLNINDGKAAEARNWIANFAESKITSAAKQMTDIAINHENNIDGGTVYTLSLSASGYGKLEIEAGLIPDNPAFVDGMKKRKDKLSDDHKDWEKEFNNQIDVMIIVSNDVESIAVGRVNNLIVQFNNIFDVVKIQRGEILRNEHGIGIEHFGYADGISQPLFFDKEVARQSNHTAWHDEAQLNLALVKDKGGKFTDSFGSYLVFRKLEQNVKAFKEAEDKLPRAKDGGGNLNRELAGAMIVGRFEDGTEATSSSIESGIADEKDFNNDFDYSDDKNGSKCPFHSHIRITNPRQDVSNGFAHAVRLVRRGIPFNDIARIGTQGEPTKGVGLLFMCYQSDLEAQYEFIQESWANQGQIGPGRFVGQDGLIGQNAALDTAQKQLPKRWGIDNDAVNCSFSNPTSKFVTMRGGEYFFTPSMSFLKSLNTTNPA